jgi:hypothetical protein
MDTIVVRAAAECVRLAQSLIKASGSLNMEKACGSSLWLKS